MRQTVEVEVCLDEFDDDALLAEIQGNPAGAALIGRLTKALDSLGAQLDAEADRTDAGDGTLVQLVYPIGHLG